MLVRLPHSKHPHISQILRNQEAGGEKSENNKPKQESEQLTSANEQLSLECQRMTWR